MISKMGSALTSLGSKHDRCGILRREVEAGIGGFELRENSEWTTYASRQQGPTSIAGDRQPSSSRFGSFQLRGVRYMLRAL